MFALKVVAAFSVISVALCMNYVPTFEKCELVSFNKEVFSSFKYDCNKVNDTSFTISAAANLLKEVNADNMKSTGTIAFFDKEKNMYVSPEGMTLTMNACNEFKSQRFGYWDEMLNYGNITGCGLHKPGYYQMIDYPPRLKLKDQGSVQNFGKYKVNVKIHLEDEQFFEIAAYASLKPIE